MTALVLIAVGIIAFLLFSLNKEKSRNLDLRVEGQNKQAAVELKEREAQSEAAAVETKKGVLKYEDARARFRNRAKSTNKPDGQGN